MALTDTTIQPFLRPSIWRESDCLVWLTVACGIELRQAARWHTYATEVRAMAAAVREYGDFRTAVVQSLLDYGYRRIPKGTSLRVTDVCVVGDPFYGYIPAVVGPGPTLLIRHAYGVALAAGPVVIHLTRID